MLEVCTYRQQLVRRRDGQKRIEAPPDCHRRPPSITFIWERESTPEIRQDLGPKSSGLIKELAQELFWRAFRLLLTIIVRNTSSFYEIRAQIVPVKFFWILFLNAHFGANKTAPGSIGVNFFAGSVMSEQRKPPSETKSWSVGRRTAYLKYYK
jgi:hypothetical protein